MAAGPPRGCADECSRPVLSDSRPPRNERDPATQRTQKALIIKKKMEGRRKMRLGSAGTETGISREIYRLPL